jgi:hypothetical protein
VIKGPGERWCGYSNLGKIISVAAKRVAATFVAAPDFAGNPRFPTSSEQSKSGLCKAVPLSATVDALHNHPVALIPPTASYCTSTLQKPASQQQRATCPRIRSEICNKMKRPSRSVCLRQASGWPGYATTQPRGRLRPRLQILLRSSLSRP